MQDALEQRFDVEDINRYTYPAVSHMRLLYLSLTDVVAFERAVLDRAIIGVEEQER